MFKSLISVGNKHRCFSSSIKKKDILPLTKIVATIGPASENLPVLPELVAAGMRIMRINFSHATYDEANLRMKNLKLSPGLNLMGRNMRAVMLDTQGPEIRTGTFSGGVKGIELTTGNQITLTTDDKFSDSQTADKIWISYKSLQGAVNVGTKILLDDGALEILVKEKKSNSELVCELLNSGRLGNRKGVNIPGVAVDLPAMCEKDKKDILWGVENDIDFIAASFTRKASDVRDIRNYVASLMPKFHPPDHPHPLIISKIENTEALDNFDEILKETDAIMVARGDLGVEIPMETLTNVQKEIVKKCNMAGKPVIVATQMLESMQKNPRPTRAECTDVANAVLDGADCVMLSGESAKGMYPLQAVQMMNKIVLETEKWVSSNPNSLMSNVACKTGDSTREALARAVVEASKNVNAKCIFVITQTGETSSDISKFKPNVPVRFFLCSRNFY